MPPHGLGLAKNTAPLGQSKKAVRSVIPIFQPNQRGRAEKRLLQPSTDWD